STFEYRRTIFGEYIDSTCRACGRASETLSHLLSSCKHYATSLYISRHNNALRVLYYHLRHAYGIDKGPTIPWVPAEVESVVERPNVKIYWNYAHSTTRQLTATKPDITLFDVVAKEIFVIEFSIPSERNISRKEEEKRSKYQDLLFELRGQHPGYRVHLVVLIVGCLGSMKDTLMAELEKIPVCRSKAYSLAYCMQKAVLLASMQLLRTHGLSSSAEPRNDESHSCEYGSTKYFALCGFGGILSCGSTHTALVPLDLVKCRIQVNPDKFKNITTGFRITYREDGFKGLGRGWAPTFFGYSLQGLGKFGLYEVFKVLYGNILGEENSFLWRTSLYLAASASAEFFADIALAPMEACKVKMPLFSHFACFERTVEALYKYVVPKKRNECSKGEQLIVTFAAGYIAGIFCAIVSHPADTIVSKLNQDKGSTAVDVAKKLGMRGLWKGLFPRIIMIGTLTAAQWFIYDGVKVWLRLPRPPPPEMPESLKKKLAIKQQ
ncbi:unnamed protein product, partial [Darwinula stevensoni]